MREREIESVQEIARETGVCQFFLVGFVWFFFPILETKTPILRMFLETNTDSLGGIYTSRAFCGTLILERALLITSNSVNV